MEHKILRIGEKKRIALIAHDNKKEDLLDWAKFNRDTLAQYIVLGTGTTGFMFSSQLMNQEYRRLLPDYEAYKERMLFPFFQMWLLRWHPNQPYWAGFNKGTIGISIL
jgi:hypothetical protein